jgi:hypothetical protein
MVHFILMHSRGLVVQRRLDSMLFVGLTEKHQESATTFFSLVGDQIQVKAEVLKGVLDQNASAPGLTNSLSSVLLWIWLFSVLVRLFP